MSAETFDQWFTRQGFRHFQAREISGLFARVNKGVRNSQPPRSLWPRILPTLRILDDLREHLGKPITINSAYRSPLYNRSVGSTDLSQHVQFRAIDFRVSGLTPHEAARVLLQWRDQKRFTGGIGIYSSFVHLDTRTKNATW